MNNKINHIPSDNGDYQKVPTQQILTDTNISIFSKFNLLNKSN